MARKIDQEIKERIIKKIKLRVSRYGCLKGV